MDGDSRGSKKLLARCSRELRVPDGDTSVRSRAFSPPDQPGVREVSANVSPDPGQVQEPVSGAEGRA